MNWIKWLEFNTLTEAVVFLHDKGYVRDFREEDGIIYSKTTLLLYVTTNYKVQLTFENEKVVLYHLSERTDNTPTYYYVETD